MLGETGTEQFTVVIHQDDKEISRLKIHYPLIRTTVRICISRWDLFKAMFRRQYETKINVSLDATPGMQRTIMMLDTDLIERETQTMLEQRRQSRERNGIGEYNSQSVDSQPSGVRK